MGKEMAVISSSVKFRPSFHYNARISHQEGHRTFILRRMSFYVYNR